MFLLKKFIGPLFYPVSLCVEVLVIGLILLWFAKKRQRMGKWLVSLGVLLLVVMSYGWLPETLAKPLESRYPPLMQLDDLRDVRWIVVFGGGQMPDPARPATAQLASASLARLIEGIRLHRALPQTKLILSGGAVFNAVTEARLMADAAEALGVNPRTIVLEAASKDTEDEAVIMKKMIGEAPFILVTTALHMTRSVALCQRLGMRPIPAPTDFATRKESEEKDPARFFPSTDHLRTVGSAVHEYLGMGWARLRGRI